MSPSSSSQVPSREPDEGGVEALLAQFERWEKEERDREQSLNQRAAWLLGFCGIILGLVATQAREVLLRSDELGSPGREVAVLTLALAVALVASAAWMSLRVL